MKKLFSCVIFCLLTLFLFSRANEILLSKSHNRYYIMGKEIEQTQSHFDVQVFGACHSYTSFHPGVLQEQHDLSSYVMGYPGEIVPVTYLRMVEQFKRDVPAVALVEIWGLNAYETYSSQDRIFNHYMPVDLELLPFSLEKLEVIRDYDSVNLLSECFAVFKYKERLINQELNSVDFSYDFEKAISYCSDYTQAELTMRRDNNGFTVMPMWFDDPASYTPYMNVADYEERQPDVASDDVLEYEQDIMKYVRKIIDLCEQYEVELIFYRAPYISRENELRKANWFDRFCQEQGLVYVDLEQSVDFDLATDYLDYWHLNEAGAKKATSYLSSFILDAMN